VLHSSPRPPAWADGATLIRPANGSTVSSLEPIEFAWSNPFYHLLGMGQELSCQVPAVSGTTLAGAKRIIGARRCRLGTVRRG
jgi:hypothetical protein